MHRFSGSPFSHSRRRIEDYWIVADGSGTLQLQKARGNTQQSPESLRQAFLEDVRKEFGLTGRNTEELQSLFHTWEEQGCEIGSARACVQRKGLDHFEIRLVRIDGLVSRKKRPLIGLVLKNNRMTPLSVWQPTKLRA